LVNLYLNQVRYNNTLYFVTITIIPQEHDIVTVILELVIQAFREKTSQATDIKSRRTIDFSAGSSMINSQGIEDRLHKAAALTIQHRLALLLHSQSIT
jgi:hypothetical protein